MTAAGAVRRVRALLAALAAVVLLGAGLVLLAAPAQACSCAPLDRGEQVASADAVVAGTVREIGKASQAGARTLTMTVDADRWYKGTRQPRFGVTTSVSSAACGLGALGVGERYVFFLGASDGELYANSCGGSGRATAALLAEVESVAGAGVPPDTGAPATPDTPDTPAPDTGSPSAEPPAVERTLVAAREDPPDVLGLVAPGGALAAVGLLGLALLLLLRPRQR